MVCNNNNKKIMNGGMGRVGWGVGGTYVDEVFKKNKTTKIIKRRNL